jgi:signal transduction histidine kinase
MLEVTEVRERGTEREELESAGVQMPEQPVDLKSLQVKTATDSIGETRSHLMANLLHDLRTPLVSIRGYTKMILEGRAGPINKTQQEYLSIVTENTNRVIQLLNLVVQITNTQDLRFEAFDLRDLCSESISMPGVRAAAKSVKITQRIPAQPLLVLGDRQKLKDVLADLMLNAVKFSDPGGEVVIELSGRSEGEVTIIISDTGVGIPAELFDRLLTRMSQPETGSCNPRDSLALGLSVVHDLIRMHGGQISVCSKPGEGVTFLITLPAL